MSSTSIFFITLTDIIRQPCVIDKLLQTQLTLSWKLTHLPTSVQ